MFTGNLEADVITNPYFFGKEKHLLKAQIVRITQSTVIIPIGQYILREGEPREIDPTPEYKLPGFHDLTTLNDWIHFNQNILNCGRLIHLIPSELPEGVEPEAYQKQIEAAYPFEIRLKTISNDKLPNNKSGWKIRIVGDTTDSNPLAKDINNKVNNGVIVIKSLVWPGLVTIYSNKVLSQLYYGYGFKATTNHFYPKQPQQVQTAQIMEQEDILYLFITFNVIERINQLYQISQQIFQGYLIGIISHYQIVFIKQNIYIQVISIHLTF